MQKLQRIFFVVSMLLLTTQPTSFALCEEETPEALVTRFYAWYVSEDEKGAFPFANKAIEQYVHPYTIRQYRIQHEKELMGSDPYLQGQDTYFEKYKPIVRTGETVFLENDVALVPVDYWNSTLLVIVEKTNEGWRILKVESARD